MKDLINKRYGNNFKNHLLEQYKLYVGSADKISARRNSANKFYLTLNSTLYAMVGYLSLSFTKKDSVILIILPLVGVIISLYWLRTIESYKNLNTEKFYIIQRLEEHLPAALFQSEWENLEKGKTKKYSPLTRVESGVPKTFLLIHVLLSIFIFVQWYFP